MPNVYDIPTYKDPSIILCPTTANLRLQSGSNDGSATGVATNYSVAILIGGSAAFDGTDGVYVWDGSSTTADNGTTVVKPTAIASASPGRWRQIL